MNAQNKLEELIEAKDFDSLLKEAIPILSSAKDTNDQETIDLTFRYLRGAIYMLGQEYGDTKDQVDFKSENELSCSFCGVSGDIAKLVAGPQAFICKKCATLALEAID